MNRVVFCSGRIYYDLIELREQKGYSQNTALIRIEEFSPFPVRQVEEEIAKYTSASEFIWCQEESQNAGAWSYIQPRLSQLVPVRHNRPFTFSNIFQKLTYIGRPPCPASAVGISTLHKQESDAINKAIFP